MTIQYHEFKCPYCTRIASSPGGIRFHIKLTHPEKYDDFILNYYPKMIARFKEENIS
ncbi:hypothetical protein JW865_00100 [Candidatus Bathyarchaeota archaeon]|nr:hypothetical protein [Candidatus Bathyarchaeota archaeon]